LKLLRGRTGERERENRRGGEWERGRKEERTHGFPSWEGKGVGYQV